jgi:hypothetical protein
MLGLGQGPKKASPLPASTGTRRLRCDGFSRFFLPRQPASLRTSGSAELKFKNIINFRAVVKAKAFLLTLNYRPESKVAALPNECERGSNFSASFLHSMQLEGILA